MNVLQVELRQNFDVPVETVYQAWTNPEKLKEWWKPMDHTLTTITNELQEGGKIDYIFEENKLHISGNYITLKENELLEYTWNWELPNDPVKSSAYKLTVRFKSEGNGSSLQIAQDAFEDQEGMLPHQEGWKKALNDLRNYVSVKN